MRLSWFRVYHEARTDNKLRALSDAQHRVWFQLMCLASEQAERGDICDYDDELLAIEVAGGDVDLLKATVAMLVRLRIVQADEHCLRVVNFVKRQYDKPSDTPEQVRERVTRHRETRCNADETRENACNAQIREEKIRVEESREDSPAPTALGRQPSRVVSINAGYSPDFEHFWTDYPRKIEKRAAWIEWQKRLNGGTPAGEMIAAAGHYAIYCADAGTDEKYIAHARTFLGQQRKFEDYTAGVPNPCPKRPAMPKGLSDVMAAASRYEESA